MGLPIVHGITSWPSHPSSHSHPRLRQVEIKSNGQVSLGTGNAVGREGTLIDVRLDLEGNFDLTRGKIYVGATGRHVAKGLLLTGCQA